MPDSTATIQKQIDDAMNVTGGGLVQLPAGYFEISQLLLKGRFALRGAGKSTHLRSIPNNPHDSLIKIEADSWWGTLSDMIVDGNKVQNKASLIGIRSEGKGDRVHTIENLVVQGFRGDAIYLNSGVNTVQNCYLIGNEANGIAMAPNAGDNMVLGCNIGQCGKAGISISWAGNLVANTKVFECETGAQIFLGGNKINACDFSNNQNDAIYIQPAGNNYGGIISGCLFDGAPGANDAIKLVNADYWNIQGHVMGLGGPFKRLVEFVGDSMGNTINLTYVRKADGGSNALTPDGVTVAGNTLQLNSVTF